MLVQTLASSRHPWNPILGSSVAAKVTVGNYQPHILLLEPTKLVTVKIGMGGAGCWFVFSILSLLNFFLAFSPHFKGPLVITLLHFQDQGYVTPNE